MIAKPIRIIGWVLSLTVIAALTATMVVVGSPLQARKRHADEQRSDDLSNIVRMVRAYYTSHNKLPTTLKECESYGYPRSLTDAETGTPYEYRPVAKDRFEICAVFETDTLKQPQRGYYGDWSEEVYHHSKGRVCFTLPAKGPA